MAFFNSAEFVGVPIINLCISSIAVDFVVKIISNGQFLKDNYLSMMAVQYYEMCNDNLSGQCVRVRSYMFYIIQIVYIIISILKQKKTFSI